MRTWLESAIATPRPCSLSQQHPRKHSLTPEHWGWAWGDCALASRQGASGLGEGQASGLFGASPLIDSSATSGWEPRPLGTGQSRFPTLGSAGRGTGAAGASPLPPSLPALALPGRLCSSPSPISGPGVCHPPPPSVGLAGRAQPLTGPGLAWQRTRRQGLSSAENQKRVWRATAPLWVWV